MGNNRRILIWYADIHLGNTIAISDLLCPRYTGDL